MKKTQKPSGSELGLLVPPELVYEVAGETTPWRVLDFAELAADLGVRPEPTFERTMARIHGTLVRDHRLWMMARRLYGIVPVIASPSTSPDDLRKWKRTELTASLGLKPSELRTEIEAIAAVVQHAEAAAASTQVDDEPHVPDGELFREQSTLDLGHRQLTELGFGPEIHEYEGVTVAEKKLERDKLAQRVAEWGQILTHPMARVLARQALLNEMLLGRSERLVMQAKPGSSDFARQESLKGRIEEQYKTQLLELDEIFPWRGLAGGKVSFRGALAELIQAYRAVRGNNDYRLVDGIQTAAEIDVAFRQSTQIRTPRYRLGQTTFLLSAIEGLMDPQWRPQLTEGTCKKLDIIGRRMIDEARDAIGEALPDLTVDGPDGEYPALPVPQETAKSQPTPES